MTRVIINDHDRIGQWVYASNGGTWLQGSGKCIGLERDGRIVAGVTYECQRGTASIEMHVSAESDCNPTREFMHAIFAYPFNQLGIYKAICPVGEGNIKAQRLSEHTGFRVEARISGAHPTGDLLLYTMTREGCRFLGSKYAR